MMVKATLVILALAIVDLWLGLNGLPHDIPIHYMGYRP